MAADTFPWSSAANYSSGPDTGTPTKTDPGYNTMVNLVPVGAQAMNFLLNERDVHMQGHALGWQAQNDPGTGTTQVGGAYYDAASGIWLRGYTPTSGTQLSPRSNGAMVMMGGRIFARCPARWFWARWTIRSWR